MAASMRRISAFVAALAITVPLLGSVAGCSKIQARDLIRDGNAAYADAKFEEAIKLYSDSLEIEPDGVTVYWNRACAAESLVLSLKDGGTAEQREKRKAWADAALADFTEWESRMGGELDEKDETLLHDHRLAILKADERCDDLLDYWLTKHRDNPQDEGLYTIIARTHEDVCGKPDEADKWLIKRTQDFPKSEKAWYSLAVRRFEPLFPDPESGLPFNDNIDAEERVKTANEVIDLLNKATAIKPGYRDPYVWRAMAYTQRSFARVYDELSEEPEDKLMALTKRDDLMLAWKEQKAVCDIDKIPDCAAMVDFAEVPGRNGELVYFDGMTVAGSIKKDEGASNDKFDVYTFEVEARKTEPAEGDDPEPPPEPKEGEGEGEAPTVDKITVQYSFPRPDFTVAEGEEPPTEEQMAEELTHHDEIVKEVVDHWAEATKISLEGKFEGGKFLSEEKPPAACCPPAPLSPEEVVADKEQRKEIETQLAEAAAGDEGKDKKRKGRKGK